MRDAKNAGSVQWVFLVCDVSQVPQGHGGCPVLSGQVWWRQQGLCKSRTLWETCGHHGLSYRILFHPACHDLALWAIDCVAYTSGLVGDLWDHDGGPDRHCGRVCLVHQNLGHLVLAQCHCHDTRSRCLDLEDLRTWTLLKAAHLESYDVLD